MACQHNKRKLEVIVNRCIALFAAFVIGSSLQPSFAATPLGPTPYLSFDDSPFKGTSFQYFYLEDFEDGALNTPGVAADKGTVAFANMYVDSVDADDGSINGSGTNGHSWALYNDVTDSVSFTFDRGVLGQLPTHVGMVWTDVGAWPNPNYGNVTMTAYDPDGASLEAITAFVGDGNSTGQTAEDRFFGVINLDGISRITMSMAPGVTWEVDHLQYGLATIPEPAATAALLGLATLTVITVRRRLRRNR